MSCNSLGWFAKQPKVEYWPMEFSIDQRYIYIPLGYNCATGISRWLIRLMGRFKTPRWAKLQIFKNTCIIITVSGYITVDAFLMGSLWSDFSAPVFIDHLVDKFCPHIWTCRNIWWLIYYCVDKTGKLPQ